MQVTRLSTQLGQLTEEADCFEMDRLFSRFFRKLNRRHDMTIDYVTVQTVVPFPGKVLFVID